VLWRFGGKATVWRGHTLSLLTPDNSTLAVIIMEYIGNLLACFVYALAISMGSIELTDMLNAATDDYRHAKLCLVFHKREWLNICKVH
jgi:hypothetical protein